MTRVIRRRQPWGRVDETGTVFVREADGERAVGQYPDGDARRGARLLRAQVRRARRARSRLLEQRVTRGAPAADVAKAVATLRETVADGERRRRPRVPRARASRRSAARVGELTEKQQAEAKARGRRGARRARRRIVGRGRGARRPGPGEGAVEAGRRPSSTRSSPAGRRTSRTARACPRTRRTSSGSGSAPPARPSRRTARRSSPSSTPRTATRAAASRRSSSGPRRSRRKGADGIPDYRRLLDEWKLAGRAGKKVDDALWAKFKAAGDVLYAAKAEVDAQRERGVRGQPRR